MTDIDLLLENVAAGPKGAQVGAFFDFDGTLIDGYSAALYFKERVTSRDIGTGELLATMAEIFRMRARDADVTQLMEVSLRTLAGREVDDLERVAHTLWRTKIAPRVFPDARRLVQAHVDAGHTVVLASSATRFQAAAAADDLGIGNLLVTEVEVADGMLTGLVDGPILWGEGKARAVEGFAAEHGIDLASSYAYGNGAEDLPFLETVGRPRPINPDPGLAKAAERKGWPIRRLSRPRRNTVTNVARSAAGLGGLGTGIAAGLGFGLLNQSRATALEVAATLGSTLSLAAAGVRLEVQGEEHLWSHRPAVFLFNHQSQLDVPILGALLRRDFTAVAKKELSENPAFALIGWLADIAYVDRTDSRQARQALEPAVQALRNGKSLAIAPEGTRSPTPTLLPFKKGAFHVAMQAGVPVVPIVIRNAGELMESHSLLITPGVVQVCVLPPVMVGEWKRTDLNRGADAVRQSYLDTLADWPG